MTATKKPRLRIVDSKRAYVSYRGMTGEVFSDGRWWRAAVHGHQTTARKHHRSEDALDEMVDNCDKIADRAQALVDIDAFLGAGGLAALDSRVSGAGAYFESMLRSLHKGDNDAEQALRSLMRIASKRAPARTTVETDCATVTIYKGVCITVAGNRSYNEGEPQTYWIGDLAEYDSYNLHYFGHIEKITPKTVTIRPRVGEKTKRLSIERFAWRNVRPVSEKCAQNQDTMMYI